MPGRARWQIASRYGLALLMIVAGVNHFRDPALYVAMMPVALPRPLLLVYVSGACEVLGGAGLLLGATRRAAARGLFALLLAVLPANINMAIHELPLGSTQLPTWMLWARLPLQGVLLAWAWSLTSGGEPSGMRPPSSCPARRDGRG
jgi:uncharacterized membrane protein